MSKYGEDSKEKICTLIEKIVQFQDEVDMQCFQEILVKNFALSDQDALTFIKLMYKMIPHVDHYAIPNKKLFDEFKIPDKKKSEIPKKYSFPIRKEKRKKIKKNASRMRKNKSKILKENSPQIRREKIEMKMAIKAFMDMPADAQKIIIEKWPREYHDLLNKVPQITRNEKIIYKPDQIADIIIGDRYDSTLNTIEIYSRPIKKKHDPQKK
jgi:hypothetical protein